VKVGVMLTTAVAVTLMTALSDGPVSAIEVQDQVTFRGGVDLVTATVSVRDKKGRVIRDLKQSDFEIIDSGAVKVIKTFESGESPISLAVLVDISGSMSVGGNIGRARSAVSVAMAALRNGSDEAALFSFDTRLDRVTPFTSDLASLDAALDRVQSPYGQTSLYDAIAELTNQEFYDVVFDATGNPAAMERGFRFVAHAGTYVLISVVSADITFNDPEFHKRETTLLASRNATAEDFETVVAAMREGRVPAGLNTHRMALVDVPEKFRTLLDPSAGVVKAIVEC